MKTWRLRALLGGEVDCMLVNVAEQRCGEVREQWSEEPRIPSAMFKVVGDSVGEGDSRCFPPHALRQNFGLTLGKDFFGGFSVSNASAFFNADAPDGPAHDPVRAFWTLDELENVDTSYREVTSASEKMIVRPILRPIPCSRACLSKIACETGNVPSPTR